MAMPKMCAQHRGAWCEVRGKTHSKLDERVEQHVDHFKVGRRQSPNDRRRRAQKYRKRRSGTVAKVSRIAKVTSVIWVLNSVAMSPEAQTPEGKNQKASRVAGKARGDDITAVRCSSPKALQGPWLLIPPRLVQRFDVGLGPVVAL